MQSRLRQFLHAQRFTAAFAFVLLAGAGVMAQQQRAAQTSGVPQRFGANDVIPFDAAVRRETLPNGVKVFIRHNEEPQKRVSLRLEIGRAHV